MDLQRRAIRAGVLGRGLTDLAVRRPSRSRRVGRRRVAVWDDAAVRTDGGAATRSPSTLEPIRIEFYGPDGPDRRPLDNGRGSAPPPRPAPPTTARLVAGLAAGAAIAVAIVVGLLALDSADPKRETAARPAAAVADPAPVEFQTLPPAVASTLPYPGGAVLPGRYTSDLLGISIEFTVDEATALRTARPGTILLTPVGTAANNLAGQPHVQFLRLAGWNTGDEAADRRFRGVGGISPNNVRQWIADNDLLVEGHTLTMVDGRRTDVYDLRVDPASSLGEDICVPELRPCFWFASVAAEIAPTAAVRLDSPLFGPTAIRLWLIGVDGEDPVLVQAAAVVGDEAWLDDFEATTIASLTIGETAAEQLAGAGSGVPLPR